MAAERKGWLVLSAGVPLVLIAALAWTIWKHGTGVELAAPAPLEKIDFLRVEFKPGEIDAHVVNSGLEPVTISAAQIGWIKRAAWDFSVTPGPRLARLGRATVSIPYPWVPGEPYKIALVSSSGLVFIHEVRVAHETPTPSRLLGPFALIGLYVGVIPVFLGLMWLPFLRRLPPVWYDFLLSVTVGLLVFLGVEALAEGVEASERVPGPYQGPTILVMGLVLTVLVLQAVGAGARRLAGGRGPEYSARVLAYLIAFGIGVHNLGEGLAIGGAYTVGELGLGTMLVLGFMIHNMTEGVAIAAPLTRTGSTLQHLIGMGLLAGGPTILGTWLGGAAYSATEAVLFLGIGAGAVFQVVSAIVSHMTSRAPLSTLTARNVSGFALGLLLMYGTGLLVIT